MAHKILIADDDVDTAKLLAESLLREGWDVSAAYDGRETILRIMTFEPDLLVLDLEMPILDGWNVLAWLDGERRAGKHLAMRVAVLTASPVEGKPNGADVMLLKPLDATTLKSTFERLVA